MSGNSKPSISELREDYQNEPLLREHLNADPFEQFHHWFSQALEVEIREPNAMTVSTLGLDNVPTSRTLLLKDLDDRGFTFFTNYESRKAKEMEAHPDVSLLFLWKELTRQVCVRGRVEKVDREESENYFYSRPYASRIGAWASKQSIEIPDRNWLIERDREFREKFPETDARECVPLPEFWGGYRVVPASIEFWQGRTGRLHDRFVYRKNEANWEVTRLSP